MMNYCAKIRYHLYTAEVASFEEMTETLLAQLPRKEQLFRLVFFGMPENNEQYVFHKAVLREKVRKLLGNQMPALSYVAQPPLNAGLMVEVHSYEADEKDHISYRCYQGFSYVLLENEDGRFLFAGGVQADVVRTGIPEQAQKVFQWMGNLLQKEGFPRNSIVRQWNYIERITCFEGADQHYQIFNNARSEFYGQADWSNGYPAATGIGVVSGGILMDWDAVVFARPECYSRPIDNKLQVAAHAYSGEVLAVAHQRKTTPKFERARSMTFEDRQLVYISGTAAIRGEESLKNVGLECQFRITMENISQLLGRTSPRILRVYLKKKAYYEETCKWLEGYKLNIPVAYLCADVCRDELWIEIEGIAM